jgi:hypothetical protein
MALHNFKIEDFTMDDAWRIRRTSPPEFWPDVVLDTDTYNEVDDQFAVAHALLSSDRITLRAIHAAPFHNNRSNGPEDGMEKSYEEILRLLEKMQIDPAKLPNADPQGFLKKGSRAWLVDTRTPQPSEAAEHLVRMAMSRRIEYQPLYVAAIGALTNIASALLMEPTIRERICVVWLGGHALHWPNTREFNLKQDVAATQVVFDSGVPLVHIPCEGVTSHLITTPVELQHAIAGKNPLGDFLYETVRDYGDGSFAWSKVIWDIAVTAWLVKSDWVQTEIVHAPIVTDNATWSFDNSRHLIRSATRVNRDAIFADVLGKIQKLAG